MNLQQSFDPELFRANGHSMVDALTRYLADAQTQEGPVLPWRDPLKQLEHFPAKFPAQPSGKDSADFNTLLRSVFDASINLHSPRYVGHQVSAPLPLAALCDLAAALLNNGMAVYEMGPASTAMEVSIIQWFGEQLGFGSKTHGVLTSGGSAGNLTALLAARQQQMGNNVWDEGTSSNVGEQPAILVSASAHYSMQRAVQIMGWGKGGAVAVPLDEHFRMNTAELPRILAETQSAGRKVIGIVANACSTATGSFDPLDKIADFCEKNSLWLHVDAAHGGVAALSPKYRSLLKGIERADSVVCDAHKMMLMPALVTLVVFRQPHAAYCAFAQKAEYLFQGQARTEEEWFNVATRTMECTKRMMSFKLYACLQVYGTKLFADFVERAFDLARQFAQLIRSTPDFELAVEPDANIVCFRYVSSGGVPRDAKTLDALQLLIRQQIVESGEFYLVQTRLPKGIFLRTALMNPHTAIADLEVLLQTIRTTCVSFLFAK